MRDFKFALGMYEYRILGSAFFMKIFYHNIELGGPFSEAEAPHCIQPYKFSLLGDFESAGESIKYRGKYEFLIEYPSLSSQYNWWRQSIFPTLDYDNNKERKTVEGYENVSIAWFQNGWGGLAKTSLVAGGCVPSYLDGNIGIENWHYAIAAYGCHHLYLNSIPSFGTSTNQVALWIRVNSIPRPTCQAKQHLQLSFLFITLFFDTVSDG